MDETTRERLLRIATAQRNVSIGLAILIGLIIVASIVLGATGQSRPGRTGQQHMLLVVQLLSVFIIMYLTAATYQLSGAVEQSRGLRLTLAIAVFFVPFACIIIPPLLLVRARRMLREGTVPAGLFTVPRAELERLRTAGPPTVCAQCGYDFTGLPAGPDGAPAVCPECGTAPKVG